MNEKIVLARAEARAVLEAERIAEEERRAPELRRAAIIKRKIEILAALEKIKIEEAEKMEIYLPLKAREDFYAFCVYMDGPTADSPGFFTEGKWHLKLQAKYMQMLAEKKIMKLLMSEAPRAGKSYTVSLLHAWLIGKYPEESSMRNSYAAELAEKFSYDIRDMIQKPRYLKVFPEVRMKQDRTSINDWAITKARDSTYFCAGVGGSILGKGCKRCLPAGEMVCTNYGIMPIEKIFQSWQEDCIQVLSYDHKHDIIRYNKILDARRIISNEIIEITTESGRVLRCTENHRVWNGKAYIEAGLLRQGEKLYRPNMCVLPQGIQTSRVGSQKNIENGCYPDILFNGVRSKGLFQKDKSKALLSNLWGRSFGQTFKILFSRVQTSGNKEILYRESQKACSANHKEIAGHNVSNMWENIQTKAIDNNILLKILRGIRSLKRDRGECEPKLSRFGCKVKVKQETGICNKGQRRLEMCFMWFTKNVIDSPFRREPQKQCCEQFNNSLQNMSFDTPQITQDVITGIKRIYGSIPVYDIQVDRDTNFFASDLLVHNCATLDDPVKNIEAALSEVTSNSTWNWYTSTHMSRLESGCAELHVATRWSRKDPIGRLTEGRRLIEIEPFVYRVEGADDTVVIIIPAMINGKSFCEEIHTTEEYLAIKDITEEFIWEAEYMQNPIESKGLLFPVEELKRFTLKEIDGKRIDAVVGFTDTADEGTDFLCSPVGKKIGEFTYVTDVVFTQDPIEVTEPLVAQQIIDTGCELMKIESNSGGKGFALNVGKLIKGKSTCGVAFEPEGSNKETRILMGAGYIKSNFYFRSDYAPGSDYDNYMRWLTSYVRMGHNKHDDAPDGTTGLAAYMKLLTVRPGKKKAPVGWYSEEELRDRGYKPYEIKEFMKTMQKSWEKTETAGGVK